MAITSLLLTIAFLVISCISLAGYAWDLRRRLDKSEESVDRLTRLLAGLTEKPPTVTAADILKKRNHLFRPGTSWSDERAKLEAQHDTKTQENERRVAEFEKQGA